VWFDYSGLDQLAVLEAVDWSGHAQEILEREPAELRADEALVLRTTLDGCSFGSR
jgi:hypothetical protein